MHLRILAVLVLTLWVLELQAATFEAPSLRRVAPREYAAHPQNWSAITLDDGTLLVANGSGLLVYDGREFKQVSMPNGQLARSLAKGADGAVYVGGVDELAVLGSDAAGHWVLTSVTPAIPQDARPLGYVWDIVRTQDATWFRAGKRLLRLDAAGFSNPLDADANVLAMTVTGQTVHLLLHERGLCQLTAGALTCRPGSRSLAHPGARLWSDRDAGLLLAPAAGGVVRVPADQGASPAPWLAAADSGRVLALQALADGRFAVGTASRGLLIVDASGHVGARLDHDHGYAIEPVLGLAVDLRRALWLTMDRGLARLELEPPLVRFDAAVGVRDRPAALLVHDGDRYLGTSHGLLRWHLNAWQVVEAWAGGDVVDLASVPAAGGSSLLVLSSTSGLKALNESAPATAALPHVVDLLASRRFPGRVYLGTLDGVHRLQRDGRGWRALPRLPGPAADTRMLTEDRDGSLWASETGIGVRRWQLDHRGEVLAHRGYDEASGLAGASFATVLDWYGSVRIGVPGATLKVDATGELQRDEALSPGRADEGLRVFHLQASGNDAAYAIVDGERGSGWAERWTRRGAGFVRSELELAPLRDSYPISITVDAAADRVWFITAEALYALDSRRAEWRPPAPRLLWSSLHIGGKPVPVRAAGAELTIGPLRLPTIGPALYTVGIDHALAAGSASLDALVAIPGSLPGDDFSYHSDVFAPDRRLPSPGLSQARLADGAYRGSIRARDAYGQTSAPLNLHFSVAPPWFRSPAAIVVYGALLLAGWIWGARRIASRQQRRLAQLEALVDQRTAELKQNARLLRIERDTLDKLAKSDALTGLANRRHLDSRLPLELARMQRRGIPLSLVMIDLDHFKGINDRFGHETGDRVLAEVAALIRRLCRPYDEGFRYGGEEIVLLMPETRHQEAVLGTERLRHAIEHHRWSTMRAELTVTASFGITQARPGDDPQALLARADSALYRAKRRGRNRVEVELAEARLMQSG